MEDVKNSFFQGEERNMVLKCSTFKEVPLYPEKLLKSLFARENLTCLIDLPRVSFKNSQGPYIIPQFSEVILY